MNPLIEFCINNLASGAQEAREILEKDPDLDVIEYGCLSNCGLCSQSLYAIVEGDRVIADTPKELVDKIYVHLEETL
ncbi:YuzB family protein [Halobacillus halophilus]|uniref:YuzB family protein n=1 Tax=Halobacillus halophilus TaxID=1570 RepID=UPI001CD278FC|nr:YuzB family protein [Halobacillus halophilus]MCA1011078.1 YuzB family protein [Halobacillus halophilus]